MCIVYAQSGSFITLMEFWIHFAYYYRGSKVKFNSLMIITYLIPKISEFYVANIYARWFGSHHDESSLKIKTKFLIG